MMAAKSENSPRSEAAEVNSIPEKAAAESHKLASGNGNVKKMMSNLPKRPPALIQYSDLNYTVKERSGKWFGGVIPQSKTILHGKFVA